MKSAKQIGIVLPTVLISLLVLVATLIVVIGYSQRGLEFVVQRGFNDRAERAAYSGLQYLNYIFSNSYSNESITSCTDPPTSLGTVEAFNNGTIKSEFTINAIGPRVKPNAKDSDIKCRISVTGKAYRSVEADTPYATHTIDAVMEKGSFKYADAFAGKEGIIFNQSKRVTGNLYTSGILQFYLDDVGDYGIKTFTVAGTTPLPANDYELQGPGSLDRCSVDFQRNSLWGGYNANSSTFKTRGSICRKKVWAGSTPGSYLEPHQPLDPNVPNYPLPVINRHYIEAKARLAGVKSCSTIASSVSTQPIPSGYYNTSGSTPVDPTFCNNVYLTTGKAYQVRGGNAPIYIHGQLIMDGNTFTNTTNEPVIIYVRGRIEVKNATKFAGGPIILVCDGVVPNATWGIQRSAISITNSSDLRSDTSKPPTVAFMSPSSTIDIAPTAGAEFGPVVARKIRFNSGNETVRFNATNFSDITNQIPFAWKITEIHRPY